MLTALHRFAQLLGARAGDPFGMVLALLPDLILVIGSQRMLGISSGPILGFKGAILHMVDLGHFLEDDLALLDEFAHAAKYCLVTRHLQAKKQPKLTGNNYFVLHPERRVGWNIE